MIKLKQKIIVLLTAGILLSAVPYEAYASSGKWRKTGDGWIYVLADGTNASGWQNIDRKWYYFDDEGIMLTGLQNIEGHTYYLAGDGSMKTGWVQDADRSWRYFKKDGSGVYSKWISDAGKWYYLDSSGLMATGVTDVDGELYYFRSSGAMATGWHKNSDGNYCYFTSNGAYKGWQKINNIWYYFDKDTCVMATGARRIDGSIYLFDDSGAMYSSAWGKDCDGNWYYLKAGGAAYVNCWRKIGGKKFFFDENGVWNEELTDPNTIVNSIFNDPYTKTNEDLVIWAWNAYECGWGYIWGSYGRIMNQGYLENLCIQYPNNVANYREYIENNYIGIRTADCGGLIKGYLWYDPDRSEVVYGYNGAPDVGANTLYNSSEESGPIESIPEIPGLGVWHKGHVGIYIGNGYVIQAKGTKYGVVKTKLKDTTFTNWFKIPGIDY